MQDYFPDKISYNKIDFNIMEHLIQEKISSKSIVIEITVTINGQYERSYAIKKDLVDIRVLESNNYPWKEEFISKLLYTIIDDGMKNKLIKY